MLFDGCSDGHKPFLADFQPGRDVGQEKPSEVVLGGEGFARDQRESSS